MTTQAFMAYYGDILVTAAAAIATGSVILHAMNPWAESHMGKHLMAYLLSLAVLFDLVFIDNVLLDRPDPLWFDLLTLFAYTFVPITMGWRLVIQWKVRPWRQRKQRKLDAEGRSDG